MRNKPKWATPIFVEKTFTNGIRSVKVVKVFFLESFPLYGIASLIFRRKPNFLIFTPKMGGSGIMIVTCPESSTLKST